MARAVSTRLHALAVAGRSRGVSRRRLLRAPVRACARRSSIAAKSACSGRGGHGHNDILSFELWLDGINLVTDCGAYLYTASREWRNRFRSTAFHNVVQVDDEELNRFLVPDNLWQLQRRCAAARCRVAAWRPRWTTSGDRTPATCA